MKQRVIGIAVLVIAAIAVFPFLLNRSGSQKATPVSFSMVSPNTMASTPDDVTSGQPASPVSAPSPTSWPRSQTNRPGFGLS